MRGFSYDAEALFPGCHADIEAGRALCAPYHMIEAAQDRVALKRFIRKHYPSLGASIRDLPTPELLDMVNEIKELKGVS